MACLVSTPPLFPKSPSEPCLVGLAAKNSTDSTWLRTSKVAIDARLNKENESAGTKKIADLVARPKREIDQAAPKRNAELDEEAAFQARMVEFWNKFPETSPEHRVSIEADLRFMRQITKDYDALPWHARMEAEALILK